MPTQPTQNPTVGQLPEAPNPLNEQGDAFSAKGYTFTVAQNPWGQQINGVADWTNETAQQVYDNAVEAAQSATSAEFSAEVASATANYEGEWADQAGAANKPLSVSESGLVYALKNDLPDITASQPSADTTNWFQLPGLTISQVADKIAEDVPPLSGVVFSSVTELTDPAMSKVTPAMINAGDISISTREFHDDSGVGAWDSARITTKARERTLRGDSTWEPDWVQGAPALVGGSFGLFGSSDYVVVLRTEGFASVDQYGGKPNDDTFDNAAAIYAAAIAAKEMSNQINLGNNDINARPYVEFTPGATYYQFSTVALDVEAVRIDFRCDGICTISGATEAAPATRTALGYSFNRLFRTTFKGLNFVGFGKVHEWDTNNVDQATVVYDDCDFYDCGANNVPVIDTLSYDDSRSTELVFINCRTDVVPMLLDSYCDTLRFEGGRYRNYDASGCHIKADSAITVIGGIWVPTVYGNDARWFDLYDNAVSMTRGLAVYGTRFSPEGGGIPVVWNYMSGEDVARNRRTNFITFHGGSASASSGIYENGVVILQDDGTNSYAPSIVGFYGQSLRSTSGLVRTKNALPVGKTRGRFVIEVSFASQSFLTDAGNSLMYPLVEHILRPYLVGGELYQEPVTIASGSVTTSIDLTAATAGYNQTFIISGTDSTIDEINGAIEGEVITLWFTQDNGVVKDFSNGSRIFLAGGVDFVTDAFGSLTLKWHRAGNKWFEVGRCVR